MRKLFNAGPPIVFLSGIFALSAIAMFVYTTFWSKDDSLKEQGIFWFLIAIASSILPTVSHLRFQDFEVEFRREIKRVEDEVVELKGLLDKAVEKVNLEESSLTPQQLADRNAHWDDYQRRMDSVSRSERFRLQRLNTLRYLNRYEVSIRQIKEHLRTLDVYSGDIDDDFSPDFARAIEQFQRQNNMRHVDGMIGQLTLREIYAKLEEQNRNS
jgi:hypothetical protein